MATSRFDGWLYTSEASTWFVQEFSSRRNFVKFAMLVNYITWRIEWIDYDSKREEPKTIV